MQSRGLSGLRKARSLTGSSESYWSTVFAAREVQICLSPEEAHEKCASPEPEFPLKASTIRKRVADTSTWTKAPKSWSLAVCRVQVAVEAESGNPKANQLPEKAVFPVSAEELGLFVRRSLPLISLSDFVSKGLETGLQQATSAKRLRKNSQALTERLKGQSRSRARGGTQDLIPTKHTERLSTAQTREKSWKAVKREIRHSSAFELDKGTAEEGPNDWSPTEDSSAEAAKKQKIAYDPAETLSYAAARMPGCYAVALRVFDEIGLRLPDFKPDSMLDFGAGPGTAIWAAVDAWEGELKVAHAIEPSMAMRALGLQIEQQLRQKQQQQGKEQSAGGSEPSSLNDGLGGRPSAASLKPTEAGDHLHERSSSLDSSAAMHPSTIYGQTSLGLSPSIRWLQHLQGYTDRKGLARQSRGHTSWIQSTGGKRYPLVIASYSFGELGNAVEQRRALRALWKATDDVFVLIEPGTPSGSALVRAARAQILEWSTCADGSRSAHVVAPCPHDGPCPMDGTRTWCHFAQKFERTALQRHTKLRPNRPRPRSYQDERFSYVVIRRGPREAARADIVLQEQLDWLAQPQQTTQAEQLAAGGKEARMLQLIKESIAAVDEEEEEEKEEEEEPQNDLDLNWVQDAVGPAKLPDSNAKGNLPDQMTGSWRLADLKELRAASPVEAAAASSKSWSRIIRPPRRRPSQTVFNLCSAAGPPGQEATSGTLLQQTVGAADRKKWLSGPGFILLKRMDWGDLWPSFYEQNAHRA